MGVKGRSVKCHGVMCSVLIESFDGDKSVKSKISWKIAAY